MHRLQTYRQKLALNSALRRAEAPQDALCHLLWPSLAHESLPAYLRSVGEATSAYLVPGCRVA